MCQWGTVRSNYVKWLRDALCIKSLESWRLCFIKSTLALALSSERLAWAQQQSEAVIAAERLHQRALEGNGGIKMGTAGTNRRAECFIFFHFFSARPLFHMCSTCASQSLAPNTRPAGSTILADWKLPWWRWKPVLKMGGCAVNHNMVFF